MSNATLAALVAVLGTAASLLMWWVGRRDKQKDPISKHAADLALAEQAVGIIATSRDTLADDVRRISSELAAERARGDSHQRQIDDLRKDNERLHGMVDEIRTRLSQAGSYIEALLRWTRDGSPPPPPPLPSVLHDLIDPSLRLDD